MPQKENKMGVMPVKKLIVNMSLPMMISMLVQALYNIVDSIFVAQISENALTAVTLAFPIQNLMLAVGSGTGVGMNAMLSKSLGEKKFDQSDAAAANGLFLGMFSFLLFLLVGIFGARPFIESQTSVKEIQDYGATYLGIVSTLSFGVFYQMTNERLLQSTGLTFYSMISQITGAVINIIFDPIMIFGLLGFPRLGVAGAAYATVFGQCVAACIGTVLNVRKNKEIHFSLKKVFHPSLRVIGRIYSVGIPSILMISIGSIMTYLMDLILLAYSTTAAAVFGVYFKLQSFFFMPVFGLNNGLIPVLAYNYGARKRERIEEALHFSVRLAFVIMAVGTCVFELMPEALLKLFSASGNMMSLGVVALRIIAIHFPIAAISIILSSTFQAFAKSVYSLIVSVARQLVVLIPVAWLLSRIFGKVDAVWWSYPIAEMVSLLITLVLFRKLRRDIIVPLGEEKDPD